MDTMNGREGTLYDTAVLGGGPGGYEAAIRSAQYGLKTVLIEAAELGGTCLNRGCIPTKALLQSALVYEAAKGASSFGVSTGAVGYDYSKFAERKNAIIKRLRSGIEALERAHGVEIVRGFGVLSGTNSVDVDGREIRARNIILATGSEPSRPPIPGIDGDGVITSDEALSMTELPASIIIIGGGVIGMEFATLFATLGKPVTVIEMMPSILPGVDADITAQLSGNLSAKGVRVLTDAKVLSIDGGKRVSVSFENRGEERSESADCCLVCVGRRPKTAGLNLEAAGVFVERGFVQTDKRMRTSVPNIYAIGDITGKVQLAHVATAQGLVAAANCAGRDESMDYGIIPACIYTEPEIAYIGITEEKATAEGRSVRCGSFNVGTNGKAMVMGASGGVAKIVTDARTGEILGAQIFAPHATDIIAEIAVAMKCEATIEELASTVHPHPTVSEVVAEAAHDVTQLCCNAMPKR